MIDRQTFFVYGRILDERKLYSDRSFAVAAYSSRYENNELVDSTHIARAGTQYGLNLPDGPYDLLVLADQDQNDVFSREEVVGRRRIELSVEAHPEKVAENIDIELSEQHSADWIIDIPAPEIAYSQESLFFPKGSIRNLNDPLFDSDIAALGMYEPAAFLERAPTMFYALEEDSYQVPVVFVHGIGGSVREFAPIIDRLDRQRYKPWFFYYPSGEDLDQLAEIFYNIFLSGNAVPTSTKPMIVVAHSMGGLVVREALNKYRGTNRENRLELIVTIASPFGGHPSAAKGEKHGLLVLPSWRDLNPEGIFVDRLFRKPLPLHVNHQLLYAYGNPEKLKLGENSDGVVPLSSQLHPVAQRQSTGQFGINSSHTDVLKDEGAIRHVIESIHQVKNIYPESHIEILMTGGYDVGFDSSYSDREKYFIRKMGRYLSALANGILDSLGDPLLEHFVMASQGKVQAKTDPEVAWLKFIKDYPHYKE
ncbi:MAG: alpha/beta hydrolase [Gammaproteobacteria bacterium]|nr:alpha/beta hydrolase [Gammaproteobacteria bacterium]